MACRMRRALWAVVVFVTLGVSCAADDNPPGTAGRNDTTAAPGASPWASEAVIWHEARIRKLANDGGVAWEYFWDPNVEFDYRSMFPGSGVLAGPLAFAFMQQLLPPGEQVSQDRGPLHVSTDGAVFLNLIDWDRVGSPTMTPTSSHAQLANIVGPMGLNGATRMRSAFSTRSWRERHTQVEVADTADVWAMRWITAWSEREDPAPLTTASWYADDARMVDSIAGTEFAGRDRSNRPPDAAGPIQWTIHQTVVGTPDVYPLLSTSFDLDGVLMIVDGHDERSCPGRVAVLLELDDGLVTTETRYREIADARRCLDAARLPDGWWSSQNLEFDEPFFPTEDLETVTAVLDLDGHEIDLHNGTVRLEALVEWGLERFGEAGLPIPVVRAVTFTQYEEFCGDVRGRAIRAEGEWRIYLCFHEAEACSADDCAYFRMASKHVLLHELAHVWLDENVGDDTVATFTGMTGLSVWSDSATPWIEQAREHAAETIVWGLFDTPLTMFSIGSPDDETLAAYFMTLTGVQPLQGTNDVVGG